MTDLAVACAAWARQFASSEIAVSVHEDSFDLDYGQYVAIQIVPTVLEKAKVEIMIASEAVGFTVECWERLNHRVVAPGVSGPGDARTLDYVAAYLEPGAATLPRTVSLIDAVAKGSLEVQARVYRGRLVASGARIKLGSEVVGLEGPTTGADMLRLVGMGETFELDYVEWAPEMSSLADRVRAI
ncbi:hypothetical protein [Iodidimonas sp. SYSU 1G8]|uniref:hypothetical protein n=1 Tax=Iodidimonas sp. SYSU 1G8 TaxID=3133967 RepID=UPI0031FEED31